MAQVGASCVDRWEAHLVDAGDQRHPHFLQPERGAPYRAASAAGVMPQAYLSRHQAAAACERAGKRLCSIDEWRAACRGDELRRYPYGAVEAPGRCNDGKQHLLGVLFGRDPYRWRIEHLNDPKLNREPGYLSLAGIHEGCATPEGVYDLVGNLHEWVADRASEELLERLGRDDVPRQHQRWYRGNAVFVGGFFSNRGELGAGCYYTTWAHKPSYHDYSIGFRCCRAAE